MTRDDLKRQVLARVKVPAEFSWIADAVLDDWLKGYRKDFNFGPAAVLSAERELQRKLNLVQRKDSSALRADLKRP